MELLVSITAGSYEEMEFLREPEHSQEVLALAKEALKKGGHADLYDAVVGGYESEGSIFIHAKFFDKVHMDQVLFCVYAEDLNSDVFVFTPEDVANSTLTYNEWLEEGENDE